MILPEYLNTYGGTNIKDNREALIVNNFYPECS